MQFFNLCDTCWDIDPKKRPEFRHIEMLVNEWVRVAVSDGEALRYIGEELLSLEMGSLEDDDGDGRV